MATIFMDESGYTGSDLLESKQPIFTLSTIKCSEEEAKKLHAEFFRGVRATELHHTRMRKSYRQQQYILAFLQQLSETPELVKIKVVHKQYALIYRLVDTIIEPAAKTDGIDMYEDGRIIALTNLFYYVLPTVSGREFTDGLLRHFQRMMHKLDPFSYDDFFRPILNDKYKLPLETFHEQPLDFLLWHIQKGHDTVGYELVKQVIGTYKPLKMHPLDVGLVSALHLMESWRRDTSETMILIRDRDSKMSRAMDVWNTLVDSNLPPKTVYAGYSNLGLSFPIGIKASHLEEDSVAWSGLQLADILAGATKQWAEWNHNGRRLENTDDKYSERLDKVIPLLPTIVFWPSNQVNPVELQGKYSNFSSDSDYFGQILEKHYKEYAEEVKKKSEAMRRLQEAGAQLMYRVYP